MVVRQVGCHVDGITNTAKRQGSADTELVGEGSREKADDGEGRVQGRVRFVVCSGVELTTAAHAVKRVEHARAQEADKGYDDQLHRGRGEPGHLAAEERDGLVLPVGGQLQRGALHRVLGRGGLLRDGSLLVRRHVVGERGVGADARG